MSKNSREACKPVFSLSSCLENSAISRILLNCYIGLSILDVQDATRLLSIWCLAWKSNHIAPRPPELQNFHLKFNWEWNKWSGAINLVWKTLHDLSPRPSWIKQIYSCIFPRFPERSLEIKYNNFSSSSFRDEPYWTAFYCSTSPKKLLLHMSTNIYLTYCRSSKKPAITFGTLPTFLGLRAKLCYTAHSLLATLVKKTLNRPGSLGLAQEDHVMERNQ